jgi:hypothetical protein
MEGWGRSPKATWSTRRMSWKPSPCVPGAGFGCPKPVAAERAEPVDRVAKELAAEFPVGGREWAEALVAYLPVARPRKRRTWPVDPGSEGPAGLTIIANKTGSGA